MGKRALKRRLSCTTRLSPEELEAQLRASGIRNPDVRGVLNTVASKHGLPVGTVSLNATISTMRATRGGAVQREPGHVAHSMVKHDTMPVWEQLHTLKTDLRRRHDDKEETMSCDSSEALSDVGSVDWRLSPS